MCDLQGLVGVPGHHHQRTVYTVRATETWARCLTPIDSQSSVPDDQHCLCSCSCCSLNSSSGWGGRLVDDTTYQDDQSQELGPAQELQVQRNHDAVWPAGERAQPGCWALGSLEENGQLPVLFTLLFYAPSILPSTRQALNGHLVN
jgi:hypothetical protein